MVNLFIHSMPTRNVKMNISAMQRADLRSGLITKFKTDQNLVGVETQEFSYIFLMIRKVPLFRHQSTFGKFSFCSHIFLFHVSGNEVLYRDRTSPMHN